MIGLLIVCHCDLGREFLKAAELILGKLEFTDAVAIGQVAASEEILKRIAQRIKDVDQGGGVLILTDMFGGSPANLSLSFLQEKRVEVLTGVNLPMVIAAAQDRDRLSLADLAEKAAQAGKRSIAMAGRLLQP